MHFGKKLAERRYKPWSPYYLDYANLKKIVEHYPAGEEKENEGDSSPLPFKHDFGRSSSFFHYQLPVSSKFLRLLDLEVEKIALFFLRQQGYVAEQLGKTRQEQLELTAAITANMLSSNQVKERCLILHEKYQSLAQDLLQLVYFVDLNLTGVRKILKKHDKVTNDRVARFYFKSNGGGLVLQPLLLCDSSFSALQKTLETALDELKRIEINASSTSFQKTNRRSLSHPKLDLSRYVRALESGSSPILRRSHPSADFIASSPARQSNLLMFQIQAALLGLHKTRDFVELMASPMMIEKQDSAVDLLELATPPTDVKRPSRSSNILNLLSTFMYMTNYYIVAPSSGTYAEKLDGDPSFAAMIIGMTPIAALFSTILYSWWTCYNYKYALIFGSTCCMVGNLFYGAGLPCDSLTLVMIGRLLNGFGSARSINRRYIADAFLDEERTAASAIFVIAGSLGMAAGPAIASLLALTVPENSANKYWQDENAPGWFMFVAWAIYLIFLIFLFEEPPKVDSKPLGTRSQEQVGMQPLDDERDEADPPSTSYEPIDEGRPLLGDNNNKNNNINEGKQTESLASSQSSLSLLPEAAWKIPVLITFLISFLLKFMLESILSTTSTLTNFYFGWDNSLSGMYMALLGLLIFPVNVVIAYLSQTYDDRELIMGMLVLMFLGSTGTLQYGKEEYLLAQYLSASMLCFLSATSIEGPNMSLLSKVIPKSWSRGFWNTGLLATETGTFGRSMADISLTLYGSSGMHHLLNRAFGTMSLLSFVTLVISYVFFDRLEPGENL